jgi:chemotaxis family two-component system response regulator PixG
MSASQFLTFNNIIDEFKTCCRIQFNGTLDIRTPKGDWCFYYRLGRLVWATGGNHPFRRLRRYVQQFCPLLSIDNVKLSASDVTIKHWDYQLLRKLHQEKQVKREQINIIAENTISEVLFDLLQQGNSASFSCDRNQEVILDTAINFTSGDISLKETQDFLRNWCEAGLAEISPNLAPILRKPEELQVLVSERVYKNFLNIINGKHTLRELAIKVQQDLLVLSRSLLPYVRKGTIEFIEIEDLPLPLSETQTASKPSKAPTETGSLIACVDDSPQTHEILKKILTSQGLRFIGIQDSVQAIPTLIERKPDLIFLDLVMPIANGYEICAQLRRISLLADTPIVILTGSDGLVDRVRAKMVGATDFLSKPVVASKVLAMVNKHVKKSSPETDLQVCTT